MGTSPEWEEKKFEIMYGCLKKKFQQNLELKSLLLSTGNMQLVEPPPQPSLGMRSYIIFKRNQETRMARAKQAGRDPDDCQG